MLQLYDAKYDVNKVKIKIEGLTKYKDYKIESVLSTGDKTLSFSYPSAFSSSILEECYIRNETDEFVIKETKDDGKWKSVVAVMNVEDLEGKAWEYFDSTNQSIERCLDLVLVGTGWTAKIISNIDKERTVRKTNCSSWDLIQEVKKVYRVELEFDTINKIVKVYDKIGTKKGTYFIDSLNLKELEVETNSYDYFTKIIALGKDNIRVELVDNQYSDKIKTLIWKDEKYTNIVALTEDARLKLNELSKPYKSYRAKIIDLASINEKYKNIVDYKLGDTIVLISKGLKIKEEQRIVKITEYPDDPMKNDCEMANTTLSFKDLQKEFKDSSNTVSNITEDNGKISEKAIKEAVNKITIDKISTNDLIAVEGRIGTLETTTAKITDLEAINADIDYLKSDKASIVELDTLFMKAELLEAKSAEIEQAHIQDLEAVKSNMEELEVKTINVIRADIKTLYADKIGVDELTAINSSFQTINGEIGEINKIISQDIETDKLVTNVIDAININASSAKINGAKIRDLDASVITTGKLKSELIESESITSEKLVIGDLSNICKIDANSDITMNNETIINSSDRYKYFKIGPGESSLISLSTSKTLDFDIDDEYIVSFLGSKDEQYMNTYFVIRYFYEDNTYTDAASNTIDINYDSNKNSFISYLCTATVKINSKPISGKKLREIKFTLIKDNSQTGSFYAKDIKLYKKNNGSLIVDGSIHATKIKGKSITADQIATNTIVAGNAIIAKGAIENAQIADATIEDGKIKNLDAAKITAGDIVADRMKANIIAAVNGRFGNATINEAIIGNLSASKIKASVIEAINANVGTAYINTGIFNTINANKVSGGKINTSLLEIGSESGSLTISDNTIQIKDTQTTPKVRVQIGKDRNNNYGILVSNSEGEVIFDSDYGVYEQGIKDQSVSKDKIKDNTVGINQLNLEDLFVSNSAFIRNIQAVELKAESIKTGTISNDRLNLKGLISFDSLSSEFDGIFDLSNKTQTYINGNKILTGSITADKVNTRGLVAKDESNNVTFEIDSASGDVIISSGLFKSNNYSPNRSGYKIDKLGNAEFNNAVLRGNVILPNAGLTNEYDMSQIVGRNLCKQEWQGSFFMLTKQDNYTSIKVKEISKGKTLDCLFTKTLDIGETYTLSIKLRNNKSNEIVLKEVTQDVYKSIGNDLIRKKSIPSEWVILTKTFVADKENIVGIAFETTDFESDLSQVIDIEWIKLEKGIVENPIWSPAPEESLNPVRIWAGSDETGKDTAPFRVMQDGSVYATKGNFNGTFSGEVNVGNIKIYDTPTSDSYIQLYNNTQTEVLSQISGEKETFFSNNFYIRKNFDINSNVLTIENDAYGWNDKIKLMGEFLVVGNNGKVFSTSHLDPYEVLTFKNTEGEYRQKFEAGVKFICDYKIENNYSDFTFETIGKSTSVAIQGDLNVKEKFTMGNNGMIIEGKNDNNGKGFDFIVI